MLYGVCQGVYEMVYVQGVCEMVYVQGVYEMLYVQGVYEMLYIQCVYEMLYVQGVYEPGKRHWLKVKKDYLAQGAMADTADLVVLGAYFGTGNKGRLSQQ